PRARLSDGGAVMKRPLTAGYAWRLAIAIAVVTMALTAAFYLSAFVYERIGVHPHPLVALIVNGLLGIFVLIAAGAVMRHWFRPQRKEIFAPVTAALARIATGDFTVRLDEVYGGRGPFSELARSVNLTAEKLDQLEKMRREFVSDVSHEI